MLYEDRQRATSFGSDPDRYHRTRPTYPGEMVDDLVRNDPSDVLDVGCGTGIAGALFRDRGCRVLGVEIDDRMASYARRQDLEVEVAGIEEWEPAGRTFDLVVSGQAWHWVEPRRGAAKAAEVLRSGGRIGLFWNRARHPEPVRSRFDAVYRSIAPELESYSIALGHGTEDRFRWAADGLDWTGRFSPVERGRFLWSTSYTTEHWLDQLMTHSEHQALPADDRDRLLHAVGHVIDDIGGSFSTTYETLLVTAVRR